MIVMRSYKIQDLTKLSRAINAVCGDSPWMSTRSFVPTISWIHAMEVEGCHSHHLLVVEINEEVIGWCRSFPVDCATSPSYVELGIGLLSKYRNQGLGSELIPRSLQWAKTMGLRVVNLTVSTQNSIAIHIFMKCGFKIVNIHGNKMSMAVCLS